MMTDLMSTQVRDIPKLVLVLGPALCMVLAVSCHRAAPVPAGYQGLVEFDEHIVSFEVVGRVESVEVHRGDIVASDQIVAKLDESIERLTVDARRDDANAAQADLSLLQAGTRQEDIASIADDLRASASNEELLRIDAQRARKLYADSTISKSELDKANADLERATFERKSLEQRLGAASHGARPQEIARARARVAESRAQLAVEEELYARHTLRAGNSGEVIDVATKAGELAAVGTPAIEVADTTHPYVDVFVPEGQLDEVRAGQKAEVRVDEGPTRSLRRSSTSRPRPSSRPSFFSVIASVLIWWFACAFVSTIRFDAFMLVFRRSRGSFRERFGGAVDHPYRASFAKLRKSDRRA